MTRFINLCSLKGGQGTSTTAVLLATQFAQEGKQVLIVQDEGGDIDALCGTSTLSNGMLKEITPNIGIGQAPIHADNVWGFDVVITDDVDINAEERENYLVTQPCYLSLRHFASQYDADSSDINGVIIVRPEGRVLTDKDVQAVTNLPIVASLTMSSDVARASDAGLLVTRPKGSISLNVTTV